jgi:hypothetical protein
VYWRLKIFWDVAQRSLGVGRRFRGNTDSYITCYPFEHGLFTVLMKEVVCTSETSVNCTAPRPRGL